MAKKQTIDYSNLTLSEANGHWCASWERNCRSFNTDELYGCSMKRNYQNLKSILEQDQGIILPAEIAVKSCCTPQYEMTRRVYKIDEKLLQNPDATKTSTRALRNGYER